MAKASKKLSRRFAPCRGDNLCPVTMYKAGGVRLFDSNISCPLLVSEEVVVVGYHDALA